MIQRAANGGATSRSSEGQSSAASAPRLIVEDNAQQLRSGQMRKSDFLTRLRSNVCASADETLARVGRSTRGCPYIERWLSHYESKDSRYIERALRRYVPEAAAASSAADYIPAVSGRVRRAVETWATTGAITAVPDGVSIDDPESAPEMPAERSESSASQPETVSRKARDGHDEQTGSVAEIKEQLGSGRSLEGGVRARMENAFGASFSGVRVHTDSAAGKLSDNLKARAFTIGQDIAFSGGEYRPGTVVGDALIAHELAHTLQQGEARSDPATKQTEARENSSLEADADHYWEIYKYSMMAALPIR